MPYLQVYRFSLLLVQVCCWCSLLNSSLIVSSTPKLLFVSFLFSTSLLNFSICSCIVFLILLNYLYVFSYSFLIICIAIILNSLSGNFWFFFSLVPIPGGLLYYFGRDIFPWFFWVPVDLHRLLCIWRSIHLFQTLWTDFSKGSLLSMGGSMIDDDVTLGLLVRNEVFRDVW